MLDERKVWPWVSMLGVAGLADSVYLLLFQTGRLRHIVCPVFDGGCEQVLGSPAARQGGIPNSAFGVAGYTAAALASAALPRTSGGTKRTLAKVAIVGSVAALGLSALLTYAQPRKTGAWCFWCLASAGISAAAAALAISGAASGLRTSKPAEREPDAT